MQYQILTDLGNANGTLANGMKIDNHILQHGDTIELGRFQLMYLNPKVVHGAAFDRTMMAPGVRVTTDDATVVPARQTRAYFPAAVLVRNSGEEILESAVVARPDEKWGETPCAFVSLKEGAPRSESEIIEYCRERMARYKAPKHVVFGPLPKTSTGKVQKFVLRDRAKAL